VPREAPQARVRFVPKAGIRLRLESHFLQQAFDPPQSVVTFNGEMEGLTIQLLMPGSEKR
jgi:hypothetical protein